MPVMSSFYLITLKKALDQIKHGFKDETVN